VRIVSVATGRDGRKEEGTKCVGCQLRFDCVSAPFLVPSRLRYSSDTSSCKICKEMMIVKAINTIASLLNQGIDAATLYFKENGFAIAVLLGIVWFVKTRYSNGALSKGYVLSQDRAQSSSTSSKKSSNSNGGLSREEEIRQVRLRQQEIANQRAKEAEERRKQKEAEEKERKNHVAKKKPPTDGERLGNGSMTGSNKKKSKSSSDNSSGGGGGYNPLQPLASHTSSYRPTRRNIRA